MPPPCSRNLEGPPRHPLDRVRRVVARVVGGAVGEPAAGAVVEAADELANDQKIDAGTGRGAQVRVDVEGAPEGDQALLRTHRCALELREAHRAENDGVGALAGCQRSRG